MTEPGDESVIERMDRNWHRLLRGIFLFVVFYSIDRQFDFWIWQAIWGGCLGSALGAWFNLRSLSRLRHRIKESSHV